MTGYGQASRERWVEPVLDFWFALDDAQWWKVSPRLDEEICERFSELREDKRALPPESFLQDSRTALAAVVLFDQMARNMHRGAADQYSTDPLALAVANGAVDAGLDEALSKRERAILYMPFQHSEDIDDQRRSMLLFTELDYDEMLPYARKHHDIIARFGRFPHRNLILGRAPRPDEIAAGAMTPW